MMKMGDHLWMVQLNANCFIDNKVMTDCTQLFVDRIFKNGRVDCHYIVAYQGKIYHPKIKVKFDFKKPGLAREIEKWEDGIPPGTTSIVFRDYAPAQELLRRFQKAKRVNYDS